MTGNSRNLVLKKMKFGDSIFSNFVDRENMDKQVESLLFTLKKDLSDLVKSSAFSGLKGGTEVEDMDHDELKLMQMLAKDILPCVVKIGGPEARTDIRYCTSIGVDGLSAPMIESECDSQRYAPINSNNSFYRSPLRDR